MVKSTINNHAFWLDSLKWSFAKPKDTASSVEYTFKYKGKALYGTSVSEEIEIPLEALPDAMLANLKDKATDGKILRKEYRTVNGKKVLYLELEATLNYIKMAMFTYAYSDTSGTTQFVASTGINQVDKYKSEINDFLNGFDTK